jgi:hypothetical protein
MTDSSTDQSPAQLFLQLWHEAKAMDSYQRLTAITDNKKFNTAVEQALQCDSAQAAYDATTALLAAGRKAPLAEESHGCILATLRVLDQLFYLIHPRSQFVAACALRRPRLPAWLRDLRDLRMITGEYAHDEQYRLIPRGPLTRRARGETASSAESLADRFNALALVPHTLSIETKSIKIQQPVFNEGSADGVPSGKNPGAEDVIFIPVAEQATDLHLNERQIAQQKFVDFRLAPSLNAATSIMQALKLAGPIDIAFAPELVVSEDHADELAKSIVTTPVQSRIIIAGSGPTRAQSVHKQPWNEARILSCWGIDLWRQRKIWPAGLGAELAVQYGLADPSPHLHMEDNAESDTLVVADVDGLGRCVVMICQDIQGAPLTDEVVRLFQPDWVFMPILDRGVRPTRWSHQRAFGLSEHSFARFMVASSTALAMKLDPTVITECGMAIGPKAADKEGGDPGRVFKAVMTEPGTGYAKLKWRDIDWEETAVIVTQPKP